MERNCPNKGTVDATRADTRHGANVCSLALSGDDSGEATLEEVEEKFGGIEEVRGFVNAVQAQSEAIMTAAVQQGTHAAHPTAHPAWSLLSDSLTRPLTQTAHALPEWNRLYVANSLHLRPCHLLYEQHGTARLMFACDYRDSNSLGQLKDSNRLRAYVPDLSHCMTTDLTDAQQLQLQLQCSSTAQLDATEQAEPTAQHTEQRHLYEPLMGAPLEWQVTPGAMATPPLTGTTEVGARTHSTAHTARREPVVSSILNPVATCAAVTVVNRGDALTDDACRGLNESAHFSDCVNAASPVDTVAVAVHRTALTDDGDSPECCLCCCRSCRF